jgi:ABC-type transport system involved in multi-copper enzyme maturation permease subunit
MKAALSFAGMTVLSLARRRTIWGICCLTILALAGIGMVPSYGTGASARFILDLGLSTMEIGGLLLSIAIGSGIYTRDRESRTILPLLAAPLSRDEYLLGRYLGAAAIQTASTAVWCAGLGAVLLSRGQAVPGGLALAGIPLCAEGCFLLAIVILYSLWASPPLNAPLTILTFVVASAGEGSFSTLLPWAAPEMRYVRMLMPDLSLFHISDPVVHGFAVSPGYALLGCFYGFCYGVFVLSVASAVLRARDMK